MSTTPKVSVIIPVYNAGKYLQECLDSVINQTLSDIEVICIDDGSEDNSVSIIQSFSQRDSRVKLLSQQNQGAGIARNLGISNAIGQYIAFLDSDDYYADNSALTLLFNAAEQNHAMICGGSIAFLRRSKIVSAELQGVKYFFSDEGWLDFCDFQQDYYYQRFLFSREMLLNNHLVFPPYRRYQDPPFFVKAMLAAERFYAIPNVVYIYREGNGSKVLWTEEKVYDRLNGILDELNITRKARLSILHRRVTQRVQNIFNSMLVETDLMDDNRTKQAFEKIYRAIDQRLLTADGEAVNLEYLENYLDNYTTGYSVQDYCACIKLASAYNEYTKPKVSVIVPVYNVELYLRECLESITRQTLKEVEIICVNDGSTDSSLNILMSFANEDNRITILDQENRGLSGARNSGLNFVNGKYIYFIDSDDYLSFDALEKLYNICEEKQLDVIHFDYTCFNDDGSAAPTLERREYSQIYDGVSFLKILRDDHAYTPTAWSQMILSEFLKKNHITFYEGIIHEDNLFSFYVLMEAKRVSHLGQKLYHHRHRANSIMTVPQSKKNVIGYFISMQEVLKYGLRQTWSPKKSAEIWCSFDALQKDAKYIFKKLSIDEKSQITFKNPFTQLLFDYFILEEHSPQISKISTNKNSSSVNEQTLRILRTENRLLKQEIQNIHISMSYRVGRTITWLPRKIRGFIRCYQEHGFQYTIERVWVHLGLKKDPYAPEQRKKDNISTPKPNPAQTSVIRQPAVQSIKRDYDYYRNLSSEKYEEEMKIWYEHEKRQTLDLANPRTFNEKNQWLKLYDSTPIKTQLADKYAVRQWIAERFGNQYLIPLFGVWSDFEQINFADLPNQFVLKATHGSGWNIIVENKNIFDISSAREKFSKWLKYNFAFHYGFELQYMNIPPRIIAEEYHPCPYEYQFWCFNGVPKFISAIQSPHGENKKATYDLNWNQLEFVTSLPRLDNPVEKPTHFDEMLSITKKICADFAFVRVDFLHDGTNIFVGEITFTPASGMCKWEPQKYNQILGDLLTLPPKSPIPERKVF